MFCFSGTDARCYSRVALEDSDSETELFDTTSFIVPSVADDLTNGAAIPNGRRTRPPSRDTTGGHVDSPPSSTASTT